MIETVQSGPRDTGLTAVGLSAARARLLGRLRSRVGSWTIQELAEELGVHRNTVREHLLALLEDGLVEFTDVRSAGPGRPARHYRATALGKGIDYSELVTVLAESFAETPDPDELARRAGRRWGARLVDQLLVTDQRPCLRQALQDLGFAPRLVDAETMELRACPVLAAARRNPEIVCSVHAGLLEALAEELVGDSTVEIHPMASPTGCLTVIRPKPESTDPPLPRVP